MNLSTVTLLTQSKLVAANNGGTTPTDLSGYTRKAKFIFAGKSDAGSSPTLAMKLQSSPPLATVASKVSTSASTLADIKHRSGAAENLRIAAKFAVGAAGMTVSKVWLPLKKVGAPTGTFTLAIHADSGGLPTGSALATFSTLDVSTLTTAYQNILFTLTTAYDLAEGTYHLVATSDVSASASVYVAWRSITVASGGNCSLYGTEYVATATSDMEFRASGYVFADVTGGGFTGLTTAASVQTLELDVDKLGIVRGYLAVGGTSTPAFYASLVCLATPKSN